MYSELSFLWHKFPVPDGPWVTSFTRQEFASERSCSGASSHVQWLVWLLVDPSRAAVPPAPAARAAVGLQPTEKGAFLVLALNLLLQNWS